MVVSISWSRLVRQRFIVTIRRSLVFCNNLFVAICSSLIFFYELLSTTTCPYFFFIFPLLFCVPISSPPFFRSNVLLMFLVFYFFCRWFSSPILCGQFDVASYAILYLGHRFSDSDFCHRFLVVVSMSSFFFATSSSLFCCRWFFVTSMSLP